VTPSLKIPYIAINLNTIHQLEFLLNTLLKSEFLSRKPFFAVMLSFRFVFQGYFLVNKPPIKGDSQMNRHKKRIVLTTLLTGLFSFWLLLQASVVSSGNDVCLHCGMKKSAYGHSWVVIGYADDSSAGMCSIHCGAIDMALNTDKDVSSITVGEYNTHKEIEAERAYWVIGGDKPGVMTIQAKWAFETKKAADRFIQIHGGRLANFGEVMRAAFEDMYQDTLIIRKKRKLMRLRKTEKQK
jgi:copper chaperone NosL